MASAVTKKASISFFATHLGDRPSLLTFRFAICPFRFLFHFTQPPGPGRGKYDRTKKKHPTGLASIPSFDELNWDSEQAAIDWLEEQEIIKRVVDKRCKSCGRNCRRKDKKRQPRQLKCNNKKCKRSNFSRLCGTFFEGARIPIHKVLKIMVMTL